MKRDDIDRLKEIQTELLDLLDEAKQILRREGGMVYERARSYWLAHATMAITKESEWLGGSLINMDDTLTELDPEECSTCGGALPDDHEAGCPEAEGGECEDVCCTADDPSEANR
ncbi:MAG: hypothetical protein HY646_02125 [Acidobacteria bacterium]|nr:hypothetical protein [Acidobacteriota bacterium]